MAATFPSPRCNIELDKRFARVDKRRFRLHLGPRSQRASKRKVSEVGNMRGKLEMISFGYGVEGLRKLQLSRTEQEIKAPMRCGRYQRFSKGP